MKCVLGWGVFRHYGTDCICFIKYREYSRCVQTFAGSLWLCLNLGRFHCISYRTTNRGLRSKPISGNLGFLLDPWLQMTPTTTVKCTIMTRQTVGDLAWGLVEIAIGGAFWLTRLLRLTRAGATLQIDPLDNFRSLWRATSSSMRSFVRVNLGSSAERTAAFELSQVIFIGEGFPFLSLFPFATPPSITCPRTVFRQALILQNYFQGPFKVFPNHSPGWIRMAQESNGSVVPETTQTPTPNGKEMPGNSLSWDTNGNHFS